MKFSESDSFMMAGSAKNNLKDKLEDGELDLSMMQYNDVPVKVFNISVYSLENDWTPSLYRKLNSSEGRW